MSRDVELAGPICETLALLLSEARKGDNEIKILLILQTNSFFRELLDITFRTSPHYLQVIENSRLLFRSVNESLLLFFLNRSFSENLSSLISLFLTSNLANDLGPDISNFILSLIFSDFLKTPAGDSFFVIIRLFFENSIFPIYFQASGGLLSIWNLLLTPEKSHLCDCILTALSKTIDRYLQEETMNDAQNFLSHAAQTILDLPECNAPNAFQFLFDLISNGSGDLLSLFIQFEGFTQINYYIQQKNDPQLMIVYQIFRSMAIIEVDEGICPPVLTQLVDLIQLPGISDELRVSAITNLSNSVRQFTQFSPLQPQQLCLLAIGLDGLSASIFSEMCYFMATHFKIDMTAILPVLSKLFRPSIALGFDLGSLFQLFHLLGDEFSPFAILFYDEIMKDATILEIVKLLIKYDQFLTFLPWCFQERGASQRMIFLKLVLASNEIIEKERISEIILEIVIQPEMFHLLIDECVDFSHDKELLLFLLSILLRASISSSLFRRSLLTIPIVDIISGLPELEPNFLFNLFASLSGSHFIVNLNSAVGSYLKGRDYLRQNETSILKLAFGLQQEENDFRLGHLCFPCLLHKCSLFEITSDFDLWVCGQYGLENWLTETGKKISEFPGILKIARRFLLPEHARLLFDFPDLFSEACNDPFGLIPLFEFPKELPDSILRIPVPFQNPSDISLSFWFFFKDFPPSSQEICAIHSIRIFAQSDELRVNDELIAEFQLRHWYHICITVNDKAKAQVFLDAKLRYSLQGSLLPFITFGGVLKNKATWFLGGAIRFIHSVVSIETVEEMIQCGVAETIFREGATITSSTFVAPFNGFHESKCLSEHTRPVLSFPLSKHLATAYNGNTGLFKRVVDLLQENRIEDCRMFVNSLCSLQTIGLSGWSRRDFALHISILIHLCPTLFDIQQFENILKLFVSVDESRHETFDWFAFFTILLDFSLLGCALRDFVISTIFGYIARFPPSKSTSLFAVFIFESVHVINFAKEDERAIIALLRRISLKRNLIARFLAALPDFTNQISVPILRYEPSDASPLFYPLLDLLEPLVDCTFNRTYLVHILPPIRAIDLLFKIVTSTISKDRPFAIDHRLMLRFCIAHCYLPKTWSLVLTLFTRSIVDVETGFNFELSCLNFGVLPQLFLMTSLLATVTLEMQPHSFWNLLFDHILEVLPQLVEKIPVSAVTDDLQQAIVQFVCFGLFQPISAIFPFAPELTDNEDLIPFCLQPGQPFPETSAISEPFPPLERTESNAQLAEHVHEILIATLPERIELLPGVFIDSQIKDYDLEFCGSAVAENRVEEFSDWISFTVSVRTLFGSAMIDIDPQLVLNSNQFKKVIQFLTVFLLKFIDSTIFQDLITVFLVGNSRTIPNISIAIMSNLTYRILEEMIPRKLFSLVFIQFVCDRIREGWFRSNAIEIITLMLANCDSYSRPLPEPLTNLILDAFFFVPDHDLPDFLCLLLTYGRLIFAVEKVEFYVLLLDRLIGKFSLQPRIVSVILTGFSDAFQVNDEFAMKWTKAVLSGCPDCDHVSLFEGLAELAEGGLEKYQEWVSTKPLFDLDFRKVRTRENLKFEQIRHSELLNLFKRLSTNRINQAKTFFSFTNHFLTSLYDNITTARAVSACIRHFHARRLITSINFFIRQREALLTGTYRFDVNQSNHKAVTILADPLFPSKRIESSPLLYNLPDFPGKTDSVLFPMPEIQPLLPLLPTIIQSLLATPFQQFEDLVFRTPRQLRISFSLLLPISDALHLSILELILNDGKKFEHFFEVSFLYGVEPLPGLLLKTATHFFYVEGMCLTLNGITFLPTRGARILYTFYLSYFIGGYFGPCQLFGSRPVVRWPIDELLFCCQHYWLHKTVAIEFHFRLAFHSYSSG